MGVDRIDVKYELLKYINDKNRVGFWRYPIVNQFFKKYLKPVDKYMYLIKQKGYKRMSHHLLRCESFIMQKAILQCRKEINDFAFYGAFDGIGVRTKDAVKVKHILEAIFKQYRIESYVTYESIIENIIKDDKKKLEDELYLLIQRDYVPVPNGLGKYFNKDIN